MGLENRTKNLHRTMDKEISRTPVFTKQDEDNILATIKQATPDKVVQLKRKKSSIVPRLLTAALFAGIIFASYTMIDSYLTPDTATEIKKPEVKYAQELTQASSKLTYEAATQKLTLEGTVKNATPYTSEPFKARVKILKEDVADSLESKTLALEDESTNHILRPDESYSFSKVITLDMDIVDENTFKDAFEVELYTKDKTLTSFVINKIEFINTPNEGSAETIVEERKPNGKPTEEQTKEPVTATNPKVDADQKQEQTAVTDDKPKEPTLAELEQKYGKKKTPFRNVPVESRNQASQFFLNGITLGMTKEETLNILGPYDQYKSEEELTESWAVWNMVTADKNSIENASEFSITYSVNQKVDYISFFTLHNSFVEEWEKTLGEPYHRTEYGETFYYFEDTKQMLCLDAVYEGFKHYDVRLWKTDHPEEYKNAVE
ncbi:hypothetical protein ABID52_000399 [Fictibacillus halophilus]|uniref:DUF4179 domain-containing protein n=1 Tax=Fictibacillus halophilus TaxID=1610490 RepID=A0ABV2LE07_9BACL|nr:hypothetical protein [Fictibacillus halophilus]